ncbi:MAG: hypothetical protein DRQ37_02090, partial [Gammaproteobacteria bacterium]
MAKTSRATPTGQYRRTLDKVGQISTVVGANSSFKGKFSGTDSYVICGDVEGDGHIDGPVVMEKGSYWKGNIHAETVILGGELYGNAHATRKLEVASTGRVSGNLRSPSIAIAEGAVIDGNIEMIGEAEVKRVTEKRQAAMRAAPDAASQRR